MISIHLRSRYSRPEDDDPEAIRQRTAEVNKIAEWIEQNVGDESVVITGQFQTQLDGPELQALNNLDVIFATKDLPSDTSTFIPRQFGVVQMVHFALLGPIRDRYIPQSSHVYELPELIPEMAERKITTTISDHNPVSISLRLD